MRRWSLSDLALDRPVTVGMILCAVILLGVIGLAKMPLSFVPSNTEPRLWARINITRTSPEVLERDVIRPIEEQVAGIRDLERIQVGSGSWGVRVNLDFEQGTDIEARKLELRDRLERVRPNLPDFVQSVRIGAYTNFDDPVMEMRLASGTDLAQDYYVIEERIVRRIERIEGVARVELEGVAPHEIEVAVDLESATRGGVSLDDLGRAVRDARQGRSLGVLRGDRYAAGVRAPNEAADPDRFERIPLPRSQLSADSEDPDGDVRFAELGEVAKVSERPEDVRRRRRLNGRRAINLEIYAQAGASAVEVCDRIRAEVAAIADDPALDGIEPLIEEDQGAIIENTLGDLRNTGLYGGLLGVVVLFFFLHRVTTTLSASVSIPLSVLGAGGVLFLRGDELNCIVMLGLVLGVGMLIDNAVVIVEAIAQQAQKGEPPLRAARLGAREVGFATIASTLSTVIVFIPLVATDHAGPMIYLRPLGITFAIALVASLLVSQTAIPLLMGRVLKPRRRELNHPILSRVAAGYERVIGASIKHPRLALLLGLALASSAVYPFTEMPLKLGDTTQQSDNLRIRLQIAGSRGYEQIEELVVNLEDELLKHKEEVGYTSVSCSFSDHWGNCRLYPAEPFESEAEMEGFKRRVARVLPEQVGVTYRLGERNFDWHENRDRNVVEFALKGEDMGALNELAEVVATHLRGKLRKGDRKEPDDGGYDTVLTPFDEGSRELHVQLEGDRLRRLGLAPEDVATRVSLAFQGIPLGTVRGERGDLKLRLSAGAGGADEAGAGMAMLRDLRIPVADGEEVTLGSIASIDFARRPYWIQRVDRQTEARVKVRFLQADQKANWELVNNAMADFTFPPGYSWGRTTRWRQQAETNNDMLINLALCMLLVYAVMASLFESFLQPLGILLTCLLGCFGAPWMLWLSGTSLDTTAVLGMFILIGVVVNNGIMLVDKVTQLRASGMGRDEALKTAGRERIRPILMTVTTTVLGLLPMLIHHPTLAGIYYHAIAIVIAGGLITSTFMTLVFLPAAYALLEGVSQSAGFGWRHAFGRRKRK